jgi:hypothetical protein
MNGLLGRSDEAAGPQSAANRGFVPQLESLVARVALSTWGAGKKVKIDFAVANPEVPAHVSTLPPPAVGLAAAPADANGLSDPVHVPGGDEAGFARVGVGGGWDLAKSGKFHEY